MSILLTQRWIDESEVVLRQAHEAITASPTSLVRELAERLPASARPDESNPVTVVFAGQYSAGKSTIIKALTGRDDIAIGAGITTERTETYRWHDANIIDTPGIHTELRPDHDAATYEAISRSDLLAFVITNELFDAHLAEHCRQMMVDREKAAEAILVVNKMNRHADGNTPDSRRIITEDLRTFLEPYTPEQLRITFIDAECAIEAWDETDPEIKDYLHTEGNLPALVDAMDSIIAAKGTAARHTAVLYQIDHVLNQAIQTTPADDPTAQSLIIVYNQNIAAINDAIRTLNLTMTNATAKTADDISEIAAHFALAFRSDTTEADLDQARKEAKRSINSVLDTMERDAKANVQHFMQELNQNLSSAKEAALFQDTFAKVEGLRDRLDRPGARLTIDLAQALIGVIGPLSVTGTATSGIAAASGGALHQLILNAGRFAGYTFAPWQAVRLASTITKAIPFIGIAASLIGAGIDAYSQHQEQKRDQELQAASREAKATIITDGNTQINAFKKAYLESVIAPMQEIIRDLSDQRAQLTQQLAERNQSLQTLHAASRAANGLIRQIHADEQSLQS